MKAFTLTRYGDPEGLRFMEIPEPSPEEGEVIVRVKAAGYNPIDHLVADGDLRLLLPYRLPQVLGHEFSGVIEALGPGVTGFAVGDEVIGRPDMGHIGSFAPLIAARAIDLARKPNNLSHVEAGSMPLTLLTAVQAFTEVTNVGPGSKVFIQGGTGGVGSVSIQVAKHLGATVATTVSGRNRELAKELGADVVIDYRKEHYAQVLKDYDLVLDTRGGSEAIRSMEVLRPGGMLISLVGPPTAHVAQQLDKPLLRPFMHLLSWRTRRTARQTGVNYRFLFMHESGKQLAEWLPLIENGTIRPVVGTVLPFERVREAFAPPANAARTPGKTVINMN